MTSVWVGAERVPLQAGRWTAEGVRGDGPGPVLELVAEGDDGEARASAQAAWAVAGSAPLVGAANYPLGSAPRLGSPGGAALHCRGFNVDSTEHT